MQITRAVVGSRVPRDRNRRVWDVVNVSFRSFAMPYAAVKDKVDEISPQYREELLAFLDFLIFKQKHAMFSCASGVTSRIATDSPRRHAGGIAGEFYMAPDFDEPLECFKEYM